jgi:hypothetical protein
MGMKMVSHIEEGTQAEDVPELRIIFRPKRDEEMGVERTI